MLEDLSLKDARALSKALATARHSLVWDIHNTCKKWNLSTEERARMVATKRADLHVLITFHARVDKLISKLSKDAS